MLLAKDFLKSFWPEVVNWAFYLLNHCPTCVMKNITPQEAWSRIKAFIKHLRVWGCLAHMHILDAIGGKLDDKRFPCIMLGISDASKCYHLLNPKMKRIVDCKYILFEEDKSWD